MEETNKLEESRALIRNIANILFQNMQHTHKFSVGNYVYYFVEEIGHIPCKITKLLDNNRLELSDGFETYVAKASDCELQKKR